MKPAMETTPKLNGSIINSPSKTNQPNTVSIVSLCVGLVALLIAAWAIYSFQAEANRLEQNLSTKLADAAQLQTKQSLVTEQQGKDLRDAQNRVAQLEGKLNEFQSQRIALEEMSRDLARAPDDFLLAETEQTLTIASRELVLAGNVKAALIALQTVDQRLSRAEKLQLPALKRAVVQDMDRLKALPLLDISGLILKIDSVVAATPSLALAVADKVEPAKVAITQTREGENWFSRAARDMWAEVKQLVQVHELGSGEAALLTPSQGFFLRENLKLRLLSARAALLARDELHYKDDIKQARELLRKYFDAKAPATLAAQSNLKILSESPVSIAVPDITESLVAIRAARAMREASATRRDGRDSPRVDARELSR
jgi:uroporphyrin-III C-methyltransferase